MGDLLSAVLREAQRRGYLGHGDIDEFIRHARGYLEDLHGGFHGVEGGAMVAGPFVDLGSGSGVPGLVLAGELTGTAWFLVERSRARADWLTRAATRLGLADRVVVRQEAAELTGRSFLRGSCAVVVARCFASPSVAAECAAPLLMIGGRAIFSDLHGSARWDESALALLGLGLVGTHQRPEGTYTVLEQRVRCPDRFPRSPGVPARRPLF